MSFRGVATLSENVAKTSAAAFAPLLRAPVSRTSSDSPACW